MYSLDLKLHVVYYYENSNSSIRTIAKQLGISKSSICRWVNKYKNDNNNDNNNHDNNRNISNILNFLKNSLNQNPFQTLPMIEEKLHKKLNICVSTKTISKYLKIIGYTKKKVVKRLYNKKLKDHLKDRKVFMKKIKKINTDDIVCIDESYINGKIYAEYGYTSKKRLIKYYRINNNNHIKQSLIMAISNKGIIKYELHKRKGINTDIYYDFMSKILDDIQNKYILMDNVSFHKSKKIIDLIKRSNNIPLFIPSYSPDCNPIEEVFSSMKSYLRKYINPSNIDKKTEYIINKWTKSVGGFDNYYSHSFG